MKPLLSKLSRTALLSRSVVACLLGAGVALAATSPAFADGWKRHHGHGYDDDNRGYYGQPNYGQPYYGGGYYDGPGVVYVQPQRVYVQPQPVYVAPPPPPVYYQPAPVIYAPPPPLLNVVIPLRFH
jgi:hypothetical protein